MHPCSRSDARFSAVAGQNGGTMSPRQKLLLALPLVLALSAVAILWLKNPGGDSQASDSIIEARLPAPNSKVLQQDEVGIDLISGWDAELTLDGVVIPNDQVRKVGPLSRVTFTPGSGKEVEVYQAGQNCVAVKYWPLANPNQTFTTSWCFSVL